MRIYICVIVFFISGVTSAQKIWSFNDCLSYARENNLQVLASKFNEQVQENNYKIAKNEKLPTVTGTVSNNFTFGPVAEQSILANGSIGTVYNYVEGYQNDLVLESSILLYNNGSLRKNEEKNSFLLQQYQLITEKIKNEISLQLVGSYLSILLNKELMVVENNSMNTQQQDADRNQKLYNAGSIPLSILYESKANLASAKKLYENAKIEVDRSLMILAMLLQKDYRDFQIEEVAVSNDMEFPLIDIDDIVNYAYDHQPEIKSAQLGIEVAKKDIDLAKTALYPTLTGGYRINTYYQDYFDRAGKSLTDQWHDNHSQVIFLGLNIPILNKGISRIKIEQSKINQLIEENRLDQEKLNLKQTIQTAYFDVTSSYQTFVFAKELVTSTKLSYEFAQKSFAVGKINVYDMNIARNNYFNAQSQMLQAKYSFLFKLKILDFYMGKPLQITPEKNLSYNIPNPKTPVQKPASPVVDKAATPKAIRATIPKSDVGNVITPEPKKEPKPNNQRSNPPKEQGATEVKVVSQPKNDLATEKSGTPIATDNQNKTKTEPIATSQKTPATPYTNVDNERAKREVLIKERRLKLSQESPDVYYENAEQREAMIKERRARLKKGM